MYSSANNHHGDAHGWFSNPLSNMVASNVSSNHGPHATIALDSVGGIHEEGWFPVTNTRSYGEAAPHPLVHEANRMLSSYTPKPKFKTIPYKQVPLSAKAMSRGKAHCVASSPRDQRNTNQSKNKNKSMQRHNRNPSRRHGKSPGQSVKPTTFNTLPIDLMNSRQFEAMICKQLETDVLPILYDSDKSSTPRAVTRKLRIRTQLRQTLQKSLHSILQNSDPINFLNVATANDKYYMRFTRAAKKHDVKSLIRLSKQLSQYAMALDIVSQTRVRSRCFPCETPCHRAYACTATTRRSTDRKSVV